MTHESTHERPLVTFALFAYNQEKYIREAIEGAFAQTYEPLEIILSDDFSEDRTFEIMKSMASNYTGAHEIILRRNSRNVGTVDHVIRVARECKGKLLIVAAGDDVSYSQRAERLVDEWVKESYPEVIFSDADVIDDGGKLIKGAEEYQPIQRDQDLFRGLESPIRYNGLLRNVLGYSASYSKGFFSKLPLNGRNALNEDALATYVANLSSDRIVYLSENLMSRRLSQTSVSPSSDYSNYQEILRSELASRRFAESKIVFYQYFCAVAAELDTEDAYIVSSRLMNDCKKLEAKRDYCRYGFLVRFSYFLRAILFRDGDFFYCLGRLFGPKVFSFGKFSAYAIRYRMLRKK